MLTVFGIRVGFFRAITLIAVFILLCLPAAGQVRVEALGGRDVVAGEVLVKFRGSSSAQSAAFAASDADIAPPELVGRSGVVRLKSRNRDVAALLQA